MGISKCLQIKIKKSKLIVYNILTVFNLYINYARNVTQISPEIILLLDIDTQFIHYSRSKYHKREIAPVKFSKQINPYQIKVL